MIDKSLEVTGPAPGFELNPKTKLKSSLERAQDAIDEKYKSLGGNIGFLGAAIEDTKACPDSIGFFRRYQNGMIYYMPSTDAHEIHGAILEKWSFLGFERSFLGYPMTDETAFPEGG